MKLLPLAFMISVITLGCEAGSEQVRIPQIKGWWTRGVVTKKPRASHINAAYYYPFLCSIIFYNDARMRSGLLVGEWVSACAIMSSRWVAFSIDNMDRPSDNHNSRFNTIRYHHSIHTGDLKVVHGTPYGSPPYTEFGKRNSPYKKHVIDYLFYQSKVEDPTYLVLDSKEDRSRWNISQLFERNPLGGAAAGIAFARIKDSFKWDAFTLPVPIVTNDLATIKARVTEHIKFLEEETNTQKSCYAGAYSRYSKKMKWFQVMYIPFDECREVYCTYDTKACLEFPVKEWHVCFKSLVYGDLCPEDRGSPLYCPDISHSVIAILSTAPNCGWKNLPNVYTRIDEVVRIFYYDYPGKTPKEQVKVYNYPDDLKKYTLPPWDPGSKEK